MIEGDTKDVALSDISFLTETAYLADAPLAMGLIASLSGPVMWPHLTSLSLAKEIPLGGTKNIEVRLETFNLLNHFNWGNPVVNFDAANFGQILTQAGTPRILQFGIKYAF